jgi:hypothetical protein
MSLERASAGRRPTLFNAHLAQEFFLGIAAWHVGVQADRPLVGGEVLISELLAAVVTLHSWQAGRNPGKKS